jgi:hypothetical protein
LRRRIHAPEGKKVILAKLFLHRDVLLRLSSPCTALLVTVGRASGGPSHTFRIDCGGFCAFVSAMFCALADMLYYSTRCLNSLANRLLFHAPPKLLRLRSLLCIPRIIDSFVLFRYFFKAFVAISAWAREDIRYITIAKYLVLLCMDQFVPIAAVLCLRLFGSHHRFICLVAAVGSNIAANLSAPAIASMLKLGELQDIKVEPYDAF